VNGENNPTGRAKNSQETQPPRVVKDLQQRDKTCKGVFGEKKKKEDENALVIPEPKGEPERAELRLSQVGLEASSGLVTRLVLVTGDVTRDSRATPSQSESTPRRCPADQKKRSTDRVQIQRRPGQKKPEHHLQEETAREWQGPAEGHGIPLGTDL